MRKLIFDAGLADFFVIASKATSTEEIGNPPYPQAAQKLRAMGIPLEPAHRASQITRADYDKYDYIVGMDGANMHNMLRIFGSDPHKKLYKLRNFGPYGGDIADPWYTNDFDTTYDQILEGCTALFLKLKGTLTT